VKERGTFEFLDRALSTGDVLALMGNG
jgi:hypothetical protein